VTVWVIRDGQLVEKPQSQARESRGDFPTPMLSRIEPFESPVTGKEISSWRQRDRDMAAAGAVDPRDLPRRPFEERKKANERARSRTPQWVDPPA